MRPVIVLFNPAFEDATNCYDWAFSTYHRNALRDLAIKAGGRYIELYHEQANQGNLLSIAQSLKEDEILIVEGVGHGADPLFTGFAYTTVLQVGDSTSTMIAQKIAIFKPISCEVGNALSPWLNQNGTHWSVGETDYYYIVCGTAEAANAFVGTDLQATYFVLNKMINKEEVTADEFWNALQQAYKDAISQWENRDGTVAYYLEKDLNSRNFWHDNFVVKPSEGPPPPPPPPLRQVKTNIIASSDTDDYMRAFTLILDGITIDAWYGWFNTYYESTFLIEEGHHRFEFEVSAPQELKWHGTMEVSGENTPDKKVEGDIWKGNPLSLEFDVGAEVSAITLSHVDTSENPVTNVKVTCLDTGEVHDTGDSNSTTFNVPMGKKYTFRSQKDGYNDADTVVTADQPQIPVTVHMIKQEQPPSPQFEGNGVMEGSASGSARIVKWDLPMAIDMSTVAFEYKGAVEASKHTGEGVMKGTATGLIQIIVKGAVVYEIPVKLRFDNVRFKFEGKQE